MVNSSYLNVYLSILSKVTTRTVCTLELNFLFPQFSGSQQESRVYNEIRMRQRETTYMSGANCKHSTEEPGLNVILG